MAGAVCHVPRAVCRVPRRAGLQVVCSPGPDRTTTAGVRHLCTNPRLMLRRPRVRRPVSMLRGPLPTVRKNTLKSSTFTRYGRHCCGARPAGRVCDPGDKGAQLLELAASIPRDRLMIASDAPFTTPQNIQVGTGRVGGCCSAPNPLGTPQNIQLGRRRALGAGAGQGQDRSRWAGQDGAASRIVCVGQGRWH